MRGAEDAKLPPPWQGKRCAEWEIGARLEVVRKCQPGGCRTVAGGNTPDRAALRTPDGVPEAIATISLHLPTASRAEHRASPLRVTPNANHAILHHHRIDPKLPTHEALHAFLSLPHVSRSSISRLTPNPLHSACSTNCSTTALTNCRPGKNPSHRWPMPPPVRPNCSTPMLHDSKNLTPSRTLNKCRVRQKVTAPVKTPRPSVSFRVFRGSNNCINCRNPLPGANRNRETPSQSQIAQPAPRYPPPATCHLIYLIYRINRVFPAIRMFHAPVPRSEKIPRFYRINCIN